MTTNRDEIREAITQHYGARAERAAAVKLEATGTTAACCGDDCCAPMTPSMLSR